MTNRRLSFLTLFTLIFASAAQAQNDPTEEELRELEAFRNRVNQSLVSPDFYWGQRGENIADGRGLFCRAERTYFIDWRAEAETISTRIDPRTTIIDVSLLLKNSHFFTASYQKGGNSCFWRGGEGRVEAGKIKVDLRLTPVKGQNSPHVSLNNLVIDGLDFKDIFFFDPMKPWGITPFVFFDTPKWFDKLFQNSANFFIQGFLATQLKTRLDKMITAKLAEGLDQYRSAHPPRPVPLDGLIVQ